MSTLILDKVLSGYNLAKVNDNFERIEKAFNEALLHRDGSKSLTNDLDVNSQKLLNVAGIEIGGVDITQAVSQLRDEYEAIISGISEYQLAVDEILQEAISYGAVDKKSIGNAQRVFTTTQSYAANANLTLPLPYVVGKNTLHLNMNHYYDMFKGVDYEEVGTVNTQSTTIKLLKPVASGVQIEELVDGDNDLYSIYTTAEALQDLLTTSYSPESIEAFISSVSDINELGLEDKITEMWAIYNNLTQLQVSFATTVADINTKYSTITDMYEDVGTKYSLLESLYPQLLALLSDTDFDLDDLNSAIGDLNDAIEDINDAMEDIQGYAESASDDADAAASSASDAADSALEAAGYVSTINTSVNNARIWAEGTDTEVAALSGTHSAKKWAEEAETVQSAVKYISQSLTASQQAQARANIGAARNDVVNVKDFGAKGDGVTDDTDAIQAAIDEGKSVFFPDGRYVVSSTLNISTPYQTLFSYIEPHGTEKTDTNQGGVLNFTSDVTIGINVTAQMAGFENIGFKGVGNGLQTAVKLKTAQRTVTVDGVQHTVDVDDLDCYFYNCVFYGFQYGIDVTGRALTAKNNSFVAVWSCIRLNWSVEADQYDYYYSNDTQKPPYANRAIRIIENRKHGLGVSGANLTTSGATLVLNDGAVLHSALIADNLCDVGGSLLVDNKGLDSCIISGNTCDLGATSAIVENGSIYNSRIVNNTFSGKFSKVENELATAGNLYMLQLNGNVDGIDISGNLFQGFLRRAISCTTNVTIKDFLCNNNTFDMSLVVGTNFAPCCLFIGSPTTNVVFTENIVTGTNSNAALLSGIFVWANNGSINGLYLVNNSLISGMSAINSTTYVTNIKALENNGSLTVKDISPSSATATGSTAARTLAARFADVVNVKDFGAKGDGVTDDAPAINSAITYADSIGGGTVFLPSGNYLVDYYTMSSVQRCAISMKDNVSLVGAGDSTRLKLKNGANAHVVHIRDGDNIKLLNFRIDGNRSNQASPSSGNDSTGVTLQGNASNVEIANLYITDTFDYGIGVEVQEARNVSIHDVTVRNAGADGIDFKNVSTISRENTLRNITILSFGLMVTGEPFNGVDIRGQVTASQIKVESIPAPGDSTVRCGVRLMGATSSEADQDDKSEGSMLSDIYVCGGDDVKSNKFVRGIWLRGQYGQLSNAFVEKCGYGVPISQAYNNISNIVVRDCRSGIIFLSSDTSGGVALETKPIRNNLANIQVTGSQEHGIRFEEDSVDNSFCNVVAISNYDNISYRNRATGNRFFGGTITDATHQNINEGSGGTNTYINVNGVA